MANTCNTRARGGIATRLIFSLIRVRATKTVLKRRKSESLFLDLASNSYDKRIFLLACLSLGQLQASSVYRESPTVARQGRIRVETKLSRLFLPPLPRPWTSMAISYIYSVKRAAVDSGRWPRLLLNWNYRKAVDFARARAPTILVVYLLSRGCNGLSALIENLGRPGRGRSALRCPAKQSADATAVT